MEADAETHPFPSERFDLCISRFGTMFFADPVAAFVNIGRALRPGARLVLLVWQSHERNEWATEIDRSLSWDGHPRRPSERPDPFSLGDPAVTRAVLTDAGFSEVDFTDVHEPVYYGPDVEAAFDAVSGLWQVQSQLADLDAATTARRPGGCARPSPSTTPTKASCSTPEPGSSPRRDDGGPLRLTRWSRSS